MLNCCMWKRRRRRKKQLVPRLTLKHPYIHFNYIISICFFSIAQNYHQNNLLVFSNVKNICLVYVNKNQTSSINFIAFDCIASYRTAWNLPFSLSLSLTHFFWILIHFQFKLYVPEKKNFLFFYLLSIHNFN